ncbi:MAG: DUF2591 domain-containing protein [Providencia sp.]|jgi:hypothetical protein|nr:DUF2591 domain-containing protein [Providencia sp.]
MNKYTELSDLEINKKVADEMGFQSEIRENGTWIFNKIWIPFDPCNEPGQAMPIIVENKIGMNFVNNNIGWSAIHQCIIKGELEVYGKRYYRTAMELFLLMKDAENEG